MEEFICICGRVTRSHYERVDCVYVVFITCRRIVTPAVEFHMLLRATREWRVPCSYDDGEVLYKHVERRMHALERQSGIQLCSKRGRTHARLCTCELKTVYSVCLQIYDQKNSVLVVQHLSGCWHNVMYICGRVAGCSHTRRQCSGICIWANGR